MTADDVDWAAVERRARRRQWWLLPSMTVGVWAFVVLQQDWIPTPAAVAVVAGVALLFTVVLLVNTWTAAGRRRVADSSRTAEALRRHVDPGHELRGSADRQARNTAQLTALVWVFPFLGLSFLRDGPWHRPALAVPALLVVVAVFTGVPIAVHRQIAAARRWLADPPGPARALPAPLARGRLLRWCAIGAAASVVLGLSIGVVSALVDR